MMDPSATRRAFLASAALPAAAQGPFSGLNFDEDMVGRHDRTVDLLLQRQVTAPGHAEQGGIADEFGIYFAGSPAGLIDACVAALLCGQSRHRGSSELMTRIRLAAGWLNRNQHSSGNFDLPTTNFNSPPDTAFLTHSLGGAALLARRGGLKEVSELVEPILRKIQSGLEAGGVHTPNHRWVVCEALAQLWELFGEESATRRIDQWLAEGIDIDADGQFNERSTTIYNAVTDRALVVLADKLKRPGLLEPVRRNLEAMLYLLHGDGEVVTEISTRQDAYERGDMSRYWFPLHYMAVHGNDGRFASLARRYRDRASLSLSLQYAQLRAPLPPDAPLPESFSRQLDAVRAARVRRGRRSTTVLWNGSNRFFTFRAGGCVIEGIRFASAFFGKGQFAPGEMQRTENGWRLTQRLEGPYYQPLNPPREVAAQEYAATRALRRTSEVCRLVQSATIRESGGGFQIEIESSGTDGVPVAIEIAFREGMVLDGVRPARSADCYLLPSGYATARAGTDTIRIGPGLGSHSWTQLRGAAPKLAGPTIYLCGLTPLRHTLEIGS